MPNRIAYPFPPYPWEVRRGQPSESDAFGRLRTSDPVTLFESQHQYDTGSLLWDTVLGGVGAAAHLPNESSVRLRVTPGAAGYVIRQSRDYVRYQPGKSQQILMTAVVGTHDANLLSWKELGYGDDQNGILFQQEFDGRLFWVRRTYVTGALTQERVLQANWNIDKFDGTGPSGKTLDITKAQIFCIDLGWLGVGSVFVGFKFNERVWYAHEFRNENALTTVFMTTANLPIRYQVVSLGSAANVDMIQICSAVSSEGGFEDEHGFEFSANNGSGAGIALTVRRAILSIRPATLNAILFRGLIIPEVSSVLVATNNVLIELVYDPTFAGAPVWAAVNAQSGVEYSVHGDAAAGGFAGGIVMDSFYVAAAAGASRSNIVAPIRDRYPLTYDFAGANPKALSLVATSLVLPAGSTIHGSLTWREVR